MSFTVEIPIPPSLNNIYANAGKRRVKTQSFAAWKREAAWTIRFKVPASQAVRGAIRVRLELPTNTAGDCDNRLKAAIDALVASGRIDDDRNVQKVEAERCLVGDRAVLIVAPHKPFAVLAVGKAAA